MSSRLIELGRISLLNSMCTLKVSIDQVCGSSQMANQLSFLRQFRHKQTTHTKESTSILRIRHNLFLGKHSIVLHQGDGM